MIKKELTCIGCPKGCDLTVIINNNEVSEITGFSCKVGENYGKTECINPTRILTTIIKVENGNIPMVPCKTSAPIPKDKIFDVLRALKNIEISAPVAMNQVLVKNIIDLNVDILSTREIISIK